MSYPLIILGAGASFDFQDLREYESLEVHNLQKWQPPLTNSLFDGIKFQNLIVKYSEMDEIVSDIRGKLRRQGNDNTFEKILTQLHKNEAKNDPELYKSFIALLFYLSDLFKNISDRYFRPHNNYKVLIRKLRQSGDRAVFVNFNYDLLLEKVLYQDELKTVDDYIQNKNYPIIKIHGAYNWFQQRVIKKRISEKESDINCYELALEVAEQLLDPKDEFAEYELVIHEYEDPKNILSKPYFNPLQAYAFNPALALPVVEKGNFVCPESHIDYLKKQIKEIDRIIIIGWKAADKFLHKLIEDELTKRKIPIAFVGGSNVYQTIQSIGVPIRDNTQLMNEKGFSDFISSSEGENFLRNEIKKGKIKV